MFGELMSTSTFFLGPTLGGCTPLLSSSDSLPAMNGLAKGSLQSCGVVERTDDLDIAAAGQRENEVAGAERRVAAAVDERSSEV